MAGRPKVLKLHAEARAELRESVAFYRERAGEPWVRRFKERITEGLNAIVADPERYPPVRDASGIQRLRIKQFPFSLLYINRADYIWIVAIAHGSRRPGYWKRRIPE
jgi:toxin ParE1/3/4